MSDNPVTLDALCGAIESRDAAALTGFYKQDAVLQIIDAEHPPSRSRELQGRAAIAAYFDDVCGRAMTHQVAGVAQGDRIAFTQLCRYPDGGQVACQAMLQLSDGRIARQSMVLVWDS